MSGTFGIYAMDKTYLEAKQVTLGIFLDLPILKTVYSLTLWSFAGMSHLESIWWICHLWKTCGHIWKLYRSHLEAIKTFLIFKECVMSHLEDCLICHIWKLYGWYVVTFASYIGHIWKLFRPFLSSKSVLCHIWKIVSYVTFGSYIGNIWKLYRSHLEAI